MTIIINYGPVGSSFVFGLLARQADIPEENGSETRGLPSDDRRIVVIILGMPRCLP
jgi:hypothetical protein